jgi:hypothetical protein
LHVGNDVVDYESISAADRFKNEVSSHLSNIQYLELARDWIALWLLHKPSSPYSSFS